MEFEKRRMRPQSIIDLGCGNGRNSVYFAKKYGSEVTVVDNDLQMLNWTRQTFENYALNCKTIFSNIEELDKYPSITNGKFDVVILSYVIQHIDPAYYPFILDLCKNICSGYTVIDIFWNPQRVSPSQLNQIDSINWYGLTYEEILLLVAPRFHILGHHLRKTDISIVINMLMDMGETKINTILRDDVYHSSRKLRTYSHGNIRIRSPPKIDEFTSAKVLGFHYASQFDLVKQEMNDWVVARYGRLSMAIMAAKFLILCRINKIPVTFREVAQDYRISTKVLMQILATTEYVPPLNVADYIERCSKILNIPDDVTKTAISLIDTNHLWGSSPTVRAGCSIIQAANTHEFKIKKSKVAEALKISSVAINIHLAEV